MASTRAPDDAAIVRALRALADPARFRMVQEIAAAGELTCGEVAEHFDIAQPTISHHLKVLVDAGVVLKRSEGKHHITSVNHDLLAQLGDVFAGGLARGKRKKAR